MDEACRLLRDQSWGGWGEEASWGIVVVQSKVTISLSTRMRAEATRTRALVYVCAYRHHGGAYRRRS